jgi:hypothetical protein
MTYAPWLLTMGALLALFAAVYLLTFVVRARHSVERDAIRYQLFAARDKLYLAAADGRMPEDVFRKARDSINVVLRGSEIAGAAVFFYAIRMGGPSLDEFVQRLPEEARQPYLDVMSDVGHAILALLTLNSRFVRIERWLRRTAKAEAGRSQRVERAIDEIQRLRSTFGESAHAL